MFRPMRRKRQELTKEMTEEILHRNTAGVLALAGDEEFPYAVPISYVYDGTHIYFHTAVTGHKVDALQQNPNASFAVIDRDEIIPEKYTTAYRSVVVFGRIRIVEDDAEKRATARKLALKYAPHNTEEQHTRAIDGAWKGFHMLEMTIVHITGKQGEELVGKE